MSSGVHHIQIARQAPRLRRDLAVLLGFLTVPFLLAALPGPVPAAQAAELQVPVSIAMRSAVAEVAAAFEKRSGHTVKMTAAAPGEIVAALQAGRHADVVVLTDGGLTELENKGVVPRGRVPLATTGFGVATRSGDLGPGHLDIRIAADGAAGSEQGDL